MMTRAITEFFDLGGKGAIVTGGATGIGKAIALRLAEAGASVVIADIDLEGASRTAEAILADGGKAQAVAADAGSPVDARKVAKGCVQAFGCLDILVNNAGIYPPSPVLDMREETWDKVLNINLKGVFSYSQAAAQQMVNTGHGGRIINVASLEAVHPTVQLAHYDASKGGVLMVTKALALELAPHGILVNAVAPGIIRTPGLEELLAALIPTGQSFEEKAEMFKPRVPLGRMGEPDDVAKVVLFLASSAADYITGEMIVVDGGYLLS
jgi:2-deoxy-D-gluconate 3-dehydrogenase